MTESDDALWWAPRLELASAAAIDARLDSPWDEAFELEPADETSATLREDLRVDDCRSWLRAQARGLSPVSELERSVWRERGSLCRTLELLSRMTPYRQACLPAGPDRVDFPALLPADLAPVVSPDELEERRKASARGETWRLFQSDLREVRNRFPLLKYESPRWDVALEWVARGDVDRDGDEDSVVLLKGHLKEGTLTQLRVIVLTCQEEGGRFDVRSDELL